MTSLLPPCKRWGTWSYLWDGAGGLCWALPALWELSSVFPGLAVPCQGEEQLLEPSHSSWCVGMFDSSSWQCLLAASWCYQRILQRSGVEGTLKPIRFPPSTMGRVNLSRVWVAPSPSTAENAAVLPSSLSVPFVLSHLKEPIMGDGVSPTKLLPDLCFFPARTTPMLLFPASKSALVEEEMQFMAMGHRTDV